MSGFFSKDRLIYGPWQAFERAISRHLLHKGWNIAEVVGGSGDKGADVIASIDGREVVFQAKYSSRNANITEPIVDEVKSAMEFYNIKEGVCVSNRNLSTRQKQRLSELTSDDQGYNIKSFTGASILESFEKLPEWFVDSREPREYQVEAMEELQRTFNDGTGKGLVTLATGLGKTFVAGSFIKWLYEKNGFSENQISV